MKNLQELISVKLQYSEWGNPDAKKTALLVHGITLSSTCFWLVASRLADAGYLVRAVDLRGHGKSPATERYSLEEMAADVLRVRPDDGGAWDIAVGHSLGGAILPYVLAFDGGFAKTALLMDPALRLPSSDEAWMAAFIQSEIEAVTHHDRFRLRYETPLSAIEDMDRKALSLEECTEYTVASILRGGLPWDVTEVFGDIHIPVYVVGADEANAITPKALGDEIAAKYKNFSYSQIEGADHGLQRTHPNELMEKIFEVAALA
jgi:pimeloyl-ACP methyl ester carboxylesterase